MMKRTGLYCTLIAALLTGCVKPEEKGQSPEESQYLRSFSMDVEAVATKASISFSDGSISWSSDDRVLVYVPDTDQSAEYRYDGGVFVPVSTPLALGNAPACGFRRADE